MERRLVLDVIELSHAYDWHLVIYLDDEIFVKEFRKASSFYANLLGLDIQRVDDLVTLVNESAAEPAKFLFVAKDGEANAIERELTARFGAQIAIVRSHALFVEGNPLGVDKGDALRRLSAYLGVPQAQVMAIGDQGNDLPMLEWAGLGVAVANGSAAARSAADWIAPSVAEDGAAVAIERFLLSTKGCRGA
jgi:hydroxymethylpyrimidine pyrophosphatase-like HAD family hydrolase